MRIDQRSPTTAIARAMEHCALARRPPFVSMMDFAFFMSRSFYCDPTPACPVRKSAQAACPGRGGGLATACASRARMRDQDTGVRQPLQLRLGEAARRAAKQREPQ